jgi:hypothetical protein
VGKIEPHELYAGVEEKEERVDGDDEKKRL